MNSKATKIKNMVEKKIDNVAVCATLFLSDT
jgi:hypothetical protein